MQSDLQNIYIINFMQTKVLHKLSRQNLAYYIGIVIHINVMSSCNKIIRLSDFICTKHKT